jgi:pyridoxine kinase
MPRQKRVAAIHDISCFGKCSLTVALPIISATGIECSVIPTAVLSTHTGGFSGFTYRDLTDDIKPIADHWQELNLTFDALYTGFLGSFEQINIISDFFCRFRTPGNIILVDPVMADNGELYKIFPTDFPRGMRNLCEKADIIVPNITEACLMLGIEYREGPYSQVYIKDLLKKLASFGCRQAVLTGVYFNESEIGSAGYDVNSGEIHFAMAQRVEGYYHGTGDVYGSALLSALLNNCSLAKATEIAVDFTVGSILRTKESETDLRYGVNFEEGLAKLAKEVKSDNQ